MPHGTDGFEQTTLDVGEVPPAIEITLRVGVVASENHLQWQVEVKDASGDELLAMSSKHHAHAGDWQDELVSIAERLREHLGDFIDPF